MKKIFMMLGLVGICGIVNAQRIEETELRLNMKDISNAQQLLAKLEPVTIINFLN